MVIIIILFALSLGACSGKDKVLDSPEPAPKRISSGLTFSESESAINDSREKRKALLKERAALIEAARLDSIEAVRRDSLLAEATARWDSIQAAMSVRLAAREDSIQAVLEHRRVKDILKPTLYPLPEALRILSHRLGSGINTGRVEGLMRIGNNTITLIDYSNKRKHFVNGVLTFDPEEDPPSLKGELTVTYRSLPDSANVVGFDVDMLFDRSWTVYNGVLTVDGVDYGVAKFLPPGPPFPNLGGTQ